MVPRLKMNDSFETGLKFLFDENTNRHCVAFKRKAKLLKNPANNRNVVKGNFKKSTVHHSEKKLVKSV